MKLLVKLLAFRKFQMLLPFVGYNKIVFLYYFRVTLFSIKGLVGRAIHIVILIIALVNHVIVLNILV